MPELNVPLNLQVMAAIEAEPRRWNQNLVVGMRKCGTTYCYAGWALKLSGDALDSQYANYWETRAREVLGLTTEQGDRIFYYMGSDYKHPTFNELVDRVMDVTGIDYRAWREQQHATTQQG
jgi:hypothetical protein